MSRIRFVVQSVEPRIAIGLQNALKIAQVSARMLAFAIRRVREPNGRRYFNARRSIIEHIGQQTALEGS
jgi:hypothetical protein